MDIESQLRRDEEEVLHAYQDHLGFWTLGVGRLIDIRKGGGISKEESGFLLANDIESREQALDKKLPWWRDIGPVRSAVLLNMSFQLGVEGLLEFEHTLVLAQAHEWELTALAMLRSKWATQTPARAHRLAEQMRTGIWQ